MDMMMPVMDGWQAVRALRASCETKHILISATTALFRAEDLKSCLDSGCNSYIVKPFNGVDLQRQIRELLATKNYRPKGYDPYGKVLSSRLSAM